MNKRFALVAVSICLVNAIGIGVITDTLVNDVPDMVQEVSAINPVFVNMGCEVVETTTETTTTTTTATTETTTTTTAETTEEEVEMPQELSYDYSTTVEEYYVETEPVYFCGVTYEEQIMLANVVGGEYGSDWVPIYDKAMVVATVMNRYYDGGWQGYNYDGSLRENTIYNILTAEGQYDPFYANTVYNWNVTESCIEAVEYYFANQELFPHVTSFYGDGTYNYFY